MTIDSTRASPMVVAGGAGFLGSHLCERLLHRGDDPTQRCPDIELARRELGWQPHIPLREGLRRTIARLEGVLSRSETGAKSSLAPRKSRLSTTGSSDATRGVRVRVGGRQVSDASGR